MFLLCINVQQQGYFLIVFKEHLCLNIRHYLWVVSCTNFMQCIEHSHIIHCKRHYTNAIKICEKTKLLVAWIYIANFLWLMIQWGYQLQVISARYICFIVLAATVKMQLNRDIHPFREFFTLSWQFMNGLIVSSRTMIQLLQYWFLNGLMPVAR